MSLFIEVLTFAIPCWVINMSLNGIVVAKLYFPRLITVDKPLDAGIVWRGRRILGKSTTWFGIPVFLISGIVIQLIMTRELGQGLVLGALTGLTVYLGHIVGSIIKRRLNYKDGQFLPFVDHGDYVIFTGIVFGLMHQFSWTAIGIALLITYIVHPIVTYLSYLIKWHNDPL